MNPAIPKLFALKPSEQKKFEENRLPLYRFISVTRLFEILRLRAIPFMKVSKWDDPFEGFLVDLFCKRYPSIRPEDLRRRYHFSCWTLSMESDHIWRIYAPDKLGVRIRVNASSLVMRDAALRVQRVQYCPIEEIRKIISEFHKKPGWEHQLFFVKRKAFDAEKEVRLMAQALTHEELASDVVNVPFETSLIEDITFDPRMHDEMYKCLKAYIPAEFGFTGSISKSSLYSPAGIFNEPR
jgi:hypothetical protein